MSWQGTWALALKVFRTLRRDKRGLALMMVGPILQIAVIGFVFGSSVSHIRVEVVDQDHGTLGAAFADALNHTTLDVTVARSVKAAEDRVKDGVAWAAIVLPPGLSESLQTAGNVTATRNATAAAASPGQASVRVVLDGSNSQIVAAVLQQVQEALHAAAVQANPALAAATQGPVGVTQDVVYGQGAKYIDFFVAALMGFAVFNFTALTTVTAFVGERTSGMLARLQAGPVRSSDIVFGHAIGYGLVAAVQASVLFSTAVLAYGIKVEGPAWLAFLVVILLGVASQALGMLLSAAARRESQAIQMFPILLIPSLIVSGTFVPVFSLPGWLRPLAYAVPIYWSSDALRSVLLRGWGLDRVWPNILVLAGFATLFLLLAIAMLERQRR